MSTPFCAKALQLNFIAKICAEYLTDLGTLFIFVMTYGTFVIVVYTKSSINTIAFTISAFIFIRNTSSYLKTSNYIRFYGRSLLIQTMSFILTHQSNSWEYNHSIRPIQSKCMKLGMVQYYIPLLDVDYIQIQANLNRSHKFLHYHLFYSSNDILFSLSWVTFAKKII